MIELTKDDRKVIVKSMLPPLAIPLLATLLTFPLVILIGMDVHPEPNFAQAWTYTLYVAAVIFLIYFLIIRKKFFDLRSGIKTFEVKRIDEKREKTFDVLSKRSLGGRDVDDYKGTFWIINNIQYSVGKEKYEQSKEGDEVVFFYTERSKFRLGFDLRKNTKV